MNKKQSEKLTRMNVLHNRAVWLAGCVLCEPQPKNADEFSNNKAKNELVELIHSLYEMGRPKDKPVFSKADCKRMIKDGEKAIKVLGGD